MRELGADEHGRISYQEFLRRRLALRPEIEALRAGKRRGSPHHTHTPEYLPTSSDNSLGKSVVRNLPDCRESQQIENRKSQRTRSEDARSIGELVKADVANR